MVSQSSPCSGQWARNSLAPKVAGAKDIAAKAAFQFKCYTIYTYDLQIPLKVKSIYLYAINPSLSAKSFGSIFRHFLQDSAMAPSSWVAVGKLPKRGTLTSIPILHWLHCLVTVAMARKNTGSPGRWKTCVFQNLGCNDEQGHMRKD